MPPTQDFAVRFQLQSFSVHVATVSWDGAHFQGATCSCRLATCKLQWVARQLFVSCNELPVSCNELQCASCNRQWASAASLIAIDLSAIKTATITTTSCTCLIFQLINMQMYLLADVDGHCCCSLFPWMCVVHEGGSEHVVCIILVAVCWMHTTSCLSMWMSWTVKHVKLVVVIVAVLNCWQIN